ncbi:MAG: 4-hydroxy-tetrahydrodipicolinate synthase [Agathobacter sp.]|nr:4-hydroxy-tetrahydrodipicolinate synthase [Agathobacter sp.]
MSLFKGAGVALVTPFHEDKSVNYEELGCLLEYQIERDIDAIIVCGTTGEPVTMTEEERLSVIEYTVKKVAHRVPVIAGSGGNCTENVISFSKKAQNLGVDGLLVVTPYYNKATQQGLYEHYKCVAEAVEIPIILYNVPSRTGLNLLPDTAVRLGREYENIVAVKEASGNITQVADLISKADGCVDVYSGNDDQIVPILSLGGIGVISVLANIAPKDTHTMVMEYLNGYVKGAARLQLKYLDVIHALFCEVNPIPVKKALEFMGFATKTLRMPLTEMEEMNAKKLKLAMKNIKII